MNNNSNKWDITWETDWPHFTDAPKSVQGTTWMDAIRQWLLLSGLKDMTAWATIITETETENGGHLTARLNGRFFGDHPQTTENITLKIIAKATPQ